jgi:predicted dienelactone hydrolase
MKLYFRLIVFIGLLLLSLSLTLPLAAQEEGGPPQVGLRPDAPTYALHGPYWVGTMEFEAETEFHSTTVAVWYPALNPVGAQERITYHQYMLGLGRIVPWQGHAIENATPDESGGPYPLVIFAHGLYLARFGSSYLSEHLASHGFVVMAIDYADSLRTSWTIDVDLSMYTRPKDVSWQIDYADALTDAGGALAGLIDTQHVAVVGHSYGAYTALEAGGARLDLSGPTSACVIYADLIAAPDLDPRPQSVMCADTIRKLVPLVGLESAPADLWPSWGDPRVDAIVPLAPDMFSYGAESLEDVTVPTMIMVGTRDNQLRSAPLYQPYLYDNLNSATKALVMFDSADHSIFFSSCEDAPWLVDELEIFWACSDPVWDMDRAHDLVNHFATAFLLRVLKDDRTAGVELNEHMVSFAGITYQAQGF